MAKAEQLEKEAKAAEQKENKPLPELKSPMTRLPQEIRKAVALRCREVGKSFSVTTAGMWVELLKKEKRVPADLKVDLSPKRAAPGLRKKVQEYESKVKDLEAQLAALKASKK